MEADSITGVDDSNIRLMRALAEELKAPLLHIARNAEMGQIDARSLQTIETSADSALRLLDSYILTTEITTQQKLELEPVALTATMYDVAQAVYKLSKLHGNEIEIEVHGKPGRVMAHADGLHAALTSLAYTFIAGSSKKKQRIVLLSQRLGEGVTTGVVSDSLHISKQDLDQARLLFGAVNMPMSNAMHSTGVGLYIADALFSAMHSSIKVAQHKHNNGVVALLAPSPQLALL